MNETRYPQGTIRAARIRYIAEFWDGSEFVALPGVYRSLEAALVAFTQEENQ